MMHPSLARGHKVSELQQRLQHQLFPVGHDAEVPKLLLEVGPHFEGKVGVEVLWLVGNGILLAAERLRAQQRLAEYLADVALGFVGVNDEGTTLLLDKEVEVGREFELGKVDTKGRTHIATESLHRDDVDRGDTQAEAHGILDGLWRDAKLHPSQSLCLHAYATPRQVRLLQKGDGIVRLGERFVLVNSVRPGGGTPRRRLHRRCGARPGGKGCCRSRPSRRRSDDSGGRGRCRRSSDLCGSRRSRGSHGGRGSHGSHGSRGSRRSRGSGAHSGSSCRGRCRSGLCLDRGSRGVPLGAVLATLLLTLGGDGGRRRRRRRPVLRYRVVPSRRWHHLFHPSGGSSDDGGFFSPDGGSSGVIRICASRLRTHAGRGRAGRGSGASRLVARAKDLLNDAPSPTLAPGRSVV
mmetsp:Transcript_2754/g.7223  ORF Transcript_2754/g.7223 Transcript_2754/m.7223 type:complete len:407 (-) Transcript_2754:531-1751(-)